MPIPELIPPWSLEGAQNEQLLFVLAFILLSLSISLSSLSLSFYLSLFISLSLYSLLIWLSFLASVARYALFSPNAASASSSIGWNI